MRQIPVENGKYTVVIPETQEEWAKSECFHALRYGEPWRDLCGDNLILCLATELEEARAELKRLKTPHAPLIPIPGSKEF